MCDRGLRTGDFRLSIVDCRLILGGCESNRKSQIANRKSKEARRA